MCRFTPIHPIRMANDSRTDRSPWAVFLIFLKLGLTSFGGPIAHLAYFREEFVSRRQWLSDRSYVDLVALCQFLPGPASSQVGLALGMSRSGYAGALAAWAGFTLPSAIALIVLAHVMANDKGAMPAGTLHGLKVVAVAVVAQAVWGMAKQLCPDALRVAIMVAACGLVLMWPGTAGQIGALVAAACVGLCLLKTKHDAPPDGTPITITRRAGAFWLMLFFALLVGLPLLTSVFPNHVLALVDAFYRAGSLVFGGGHVVMPLLQAEVVATGWVDNDAFLAGYGATQAVPGPLFTFAAYLGASLNQSPAGWLGGLICLVAIFVPSFLLVAGALPFWDGMRSNAHARAALMGINAAVVGLLLAALYQPLWTSSILAPQDFLLALAALVALMVWKLPPWLVVLGSGLIGVVLA